MVSSLVRKVSKKVHDGLLESKDHEAAEKKADANQREAEAERQLAQLQRELVTPTHGVSAALSRVRRLKLSSCWACRAAW